MRELSLPPFGTAGDHAAARRAAVAMTLGFGLGPLVTGVLAQWAPEPTVVPYLPHIVLMAAVLGMLRNAPETVAGRAGPVVRLSAPGARHPRFRWIVAPMAPWVFAAPAIAFALLPSVVGADQATHGIALTAAVTSVTAMAGVLIQPLARSLDARARTTRSATIGLLVLAAGLVLGAATVQSGETWLLVPAAVVLGSAYGLCLVAGLVEIQRLTSDGALAGLTAIYYALAYLGFAAPYVFVLASHVADYSNLLIVAAALALATAGVVSPQARRLVT
jgi:hypothetical protein